MFQKRGEKRSYQSRNKKKVTLGDKGREVAENIDETNPVIQQFRLYSKELLDKHDRFERITKLSRDITIESKRVILLLHTIDTAAKHDRILAEAKQKLDNVKLQLFKAIAQELKNEDQYQYLRAYKPGLAEYVEALTFYQYLESEDIQNWNALQKGLTYEQSDKFDVKSDDTTTAEETIATLVTPHEFISGMGDLTGELMRRCVNNLAIGDIASCYQTCNFVRNMYKGFLSCPNTYNKEINRKICTLKQSLHKIENVCYTIQVRGSEVPKHLLMDVANKDADDDKEVYEIC